MAICINRNSMEYQDLQKRSGVPLEILDSTCVKYLEKYGRLPYLDEIPGSNSKAHLESELKLNKSKGTTIDKVLEVSGTKSVEEATIRLNDIYRDTEVDIIPVEDEAIVNVTPRPTDEYKPIKKWYDVDVNPNMSSVLNHAIDKLQDLYGIKVHSVTDTDLESKEWSDIIERDKFVKAFIYKGEIYVNTDRATGDSTIHEMLHLLIGSIRFDNPGLYQGLIDSAESFESYPALALSFAGKTRNDMNEEIFVQELAKHLAGMDSQISNLSELALYTINYNIRRVLDTIFMGDFSTKTIEDKYLYNMSFKLVARATNSSALTSQFKGYLNVEGSELHRLLNNLKEKLLREGTLEENCE